MKKRSRMKENGRRENDPKFFFNGSYINITANFDNQFTATATDIAEARAFGGKISLMIIQVIGPNPTENDTRYTARARKVQNELMLSVEKKESRVSPIKLPAALINVKLLLPDFSTNHIERSVPNIIMHPTKIEITP